MNTSKSSFVYPGDELTLFAHAINWKAYFAQSLRPYIGNQVLEVGAGIGGTTRLLCTGHEEIWLCLEPDQNLAEQLIVAGNDGSFPSNCRIEIGTISDLDSDAKFDTVIYIDVLEHIEEDAIELTRAAEKLNTGGRLIVLAPAYQWLFSEFDDAVGHFRRYTSAALQRLSPKNMLQIKSYYLDSMGLIASAANRFLLHSNKPDMSQIRLWDSLLVPISKGLDILTAHTFGRSVVVIWQKQP